MTSDEIKTAYSMMDILSRYGMQPNHSSFIRCPFHKEKTASCKIYKDSYHCYGCGANGDIFTFVQQMESISFSEAYKLLGGSYEPPSFTTRMAIYKARKAREMAQKEAERRQEKIRLNSNLIDIYRRGIQRSEPLSAAWCDCMNALQYQLYLHEQLHNIEARW